MQYVRNDNGLVVPAVTDVESVSSFCESILHGPPSMWPQLVAGMQPRVRQAEETLAGVTRAFGSSLAKNLGLAPNRVTDVTQINRGDLRRIVHALVDFGGADLRNVDLAGIPLEGIEWSDSTQWPELWVDQIRQVSVPIGVGLYVIRDGTSRTDFDVDLVPV